MTNQLLTPTEIRELASKLDLKPTKKLGQNFVTDQNTVEKIVRTSKVSKDSIVLEVGPDGFSHLGPTCYWGKSICC